LQQKLGHATFREKQWESIEHILVHQRDTILAVPTGGGKSNVFIIAGLLLTGLKAVFILLPAIELIDNQTKILRGVLEKLGSCHRCTALGTAADDPKDEHRVEHGWFRFGNVLIHTFFIFCQCFSPSRKRYRLPQWSFG
jgi:hypothetical protein